MVKTLTKALPQDDPLRGPLTTAVDDFQATLEGDLTEANAEIGALAESKGKTKAANNADAAAQLLAAARAEADLNARVKLLRKGDKKLRAAERAAEKAGAGGGGGGGNCAHPTLQAGESGSFEVDGSLVTANRGSAANFADEFRSGVQIFIESCDGSGPKPEVSLFVPDPAVQDYTIGFSAGNATGGYRDTDGFYELSSNGQLTVTEYDAASGTIAGTFAFENSRSVTAGTFRFTNIQ